MATVEKIWNIEDAAWHLAATHHIEIDKAAVITAMVKLRISFRDEESWQMWKSDYRKLDIYFEANNKIKHRN